MAAHIGRYLTHFWNTTLDSRNVKKKLTLSESYVGLLSISCCWAHAFDLLVKPRLILCLCSISHNKFEGFFFLKIYILQSGQDATCYIDNK